MPFFSFLSFEEASCVTSSFGLSKISKDTFNCLHFSSILSKHYHKTSFPTLGFIVTVDIIYLGGAIILILTGISSV